jgi:hypothetical protein
MLQPQLSARAHRHLQFRNLPGHRVLGDPVALQEPAVAVGHGVIDGLVFAQ